MRLRYTLRARADLEAIFTYLDEQSPSRAGAVRSDIQRRIAELGEFPLMGPMSGEAGVRELSLTRYPYKIYYEVDDDEIRVLHVRDARRRPWRR